MNDKKVISASFLMVCLVLLFIFIRKPDQLETFFPGFFPRIPRCTPENDCYPGSYAVTQKYHNMCQPSFGLNRQKIGLHDHCAHDLGKMSNELYLTQNNIIPKNQPPQNKPELLLQPTNISPDGNLLVCTVDKHLQRRCKWVKPSCQ